MLEKLADNAAVRTNNIKANQPKERLGKISSRYLGRLMANANESTVDADFNNYIKDVFSFYPFYGPEAAL
jgi:hypothetical protein